MSNLRGRLRQFIRAYEEELSDDPYGRGLIEEAITALAELTELKKPVEDAEVQERIRYMRRYGQNTFTKETVNLVERLNRKCMVWQQKEKAADQRAETAEAKSDRLIERTGKLTGQVDELLRKLETAEAQVKDFDVLINECMNAFTAVKQGHGATGEIIDPNLYAKGFILRLSDEWERIRNMEDKSNEHQ